MNPTDEKEKYSWSMQLIFSPAGGAQLWYLYEPNDWVHHKNFLLLRKMKEMLLKFIKILPFLWMIVERHNSR